MMPTGTQRIIAASFWTKVPSSSGLTSAGSPVSVAATTIIATIESANRCQ